MGIVKPPEAVRFKIQRKTSTQEWVVVRYVNGKRHEPSCYYTDDKKDAEDTMKVMKKHEYKEAMTLIKDCIYNCKCEDKTYAKGCLNGIVTVFMALGWNFADSLSLIKDLTMISDNDLTLSDIEACLPECWIETWRTL